MTPHRGNTILICSSQLLPRPCLGPLRGFFDLKRRPSRALNSPCALPLGLQRSKDTVRCAALGPEVPATADANLDFVFVETHTFAYRSLNVKSQQKIIDLMSIPGKGAASLQVHVVLRSVQCTICCVVVVVVLLATLGPVIPTSHSIPCRIPDGWQKHLPLLLFPQRPLPVVVTHTAGTGPVGNGQHFLGLLTTIAAICWHFLNHLFIVAVIVLGLVHSRYGH